MKRRKVKGKAENCVEIEWGWEYIFLNDFVVDDSKEKLHSLSHAAYKIHEWDELQNRFSSFLRALVKR